MPKNDVPDVVVRRLPLYLLALEQLLARQRSVVSSAELGMITGVSAAQIRKDLSYFGEFGRQGLGYEVAFLREQLRRILQADREWHLAVIGAGALGNALLHYKGFDQHNLTIVAIFDNDPAQVGLP
ncbi:MAG: redox-sensing transcriptional repressor Rex, partial [Chloroflexi bacterium]|nr:redox-sensing transcriptional repressor Rex [Chloroflexota bacterium]